MIDVRLAELVRLRHPVKLIRRAAGPALLWLLLLTTLMLPGRRRAFAQAAYAGAPVTLPSGSGFNGPIGVAVDSSGNVFVADNQNSEVKEIPYANGSYGAPVTLGSGFFIPSGVAVDSSGNLFVADSGNYAVKELPYANGSYGAPVTVASGFSYPTGVAVDSSGNVFVADNHNFEAKEIPYAAGNYGSPVLLPACCFFSWPNGVAVDSTDNVFIGAGNAVLENPYMNGVYGATVTLGSGFLNPYSVAVDSSDNVFVADEGHNAVKEIPYRNGVYGSPVTLAGGFNRPYGVAVDSIGDVFVTDNGNNVVKEIFSNRFASTAVNNTASTHVTVNFTFTAGGAIAAPAVLTQGATGLDFFDAGTGTCTTNGTSHTYSAGDSCTVVVSFTPTRPGARNGAVVLYDTSGHSLATGYISGAGTGPLVTFAPFTQSALTRGIPNPEGMAVDGKGNLFVAAGTAVYELAYANGSFGAPAGILTSYGGTALNSTQWVTVDGAGNVFVADGGNHRILKLAPGSSGSFTVSEICSSGCDGNEIAVDGGGNVYTLSAATGAIVKEALSSGSYTSSTIPLSDTNNPWSIVVDAAGDIFYSTQGDGCLREIPYGGSDTLIDCSLNSPQGMAIDLTGNLYFSETIGDVVEYTLSGGSYTKVATPLVTGLSSATGLWVDAYDNLFASDTGNSVVYKFDYADAPTLSFASTQVGSTGSSNPQTVTVLNAGNAALTLPVGTPAPNPVITAGFAYDSASTCNTVSGAYTLAAGSSCTIAVDFYPIAVGSPVTGTATLTDNSLEVAGSTQSIGLSGIANQGSQTITFNTPGTQTVATPLVLAATASSGLTVSYASSTASVCTVSGSTVTLLSAGTCIITASQAGNTTYAAATSVSRSFTVIAESQTITFATPGSQTVGTPLTLAATASSGLTVSYASSTTSVCTVSGGTATFLSSGSCIITASQAGNTYYAAAASVPRSFTVSTASQTITFANPGSPVIYGVSPIALSATASSGLTVIFSVVSGPGTVSGGTLTVTGVGTIVIAANQAGNSAYSAATQVTQSIVVESATPTITWATPSAITYGTSLASALDASATLSGSTVAGAYSYSATSTTASSSAVVTSATVLPAGSYLLSVIFTPTNSHDTTASGSTTLTVAQVSPTLSLAASTSIPVLDNSVTFTATLTSAAGIPTGNVSFLNGATALGSRSLSSGVATFTTSSLTTGAHTITAVYAGDSNFTSATSASLTETVQDFTVNTPSGSASSASVAPGQSAVYSLIFSPVGSTVFAATVNLSASGLPTGATATFSPDSLSAGSGTSTVAMTIQLPQVSAAAPTMRPKPFRGPLMPAAPAALALCLLPLAKRLRRAGRRAWPAILLLAALGGIATLTGCSSSSRSFGQRPQSYTITVTGTSGALVHSTTVSLTVQ